MRHQNKRRSGCSHLVEIISPDSFCAFEKGRRRDKTDTERHNPPRLSVAAKVVAAQMAVRAIGTTPLEQRSGDSSTPPS